VYNICDSDKVQIHLKRVFQSDGRIPLSENGHFISTIPCPPQQLHSTNASVRACTQKRILGANNQPSQYTLESLMHDDILVYSCLAMSSFLI